MGALDVAHSQPLREHLAFDAEGDVAAQLAAVPGRWCVCLLSDTNDRPSLLVQVKNLRASLKNRLAPDPADDDTPTRKIDYAGVIGHVRWCRVDSPFEADAVYLEAARFYFPDAYRGMLGYQPAAFVHVNPATTYPRFTTETDLTKKTGLYLGPMKDRAAAKRFREAVENAFDLCRDYTFLTNAPAAACPWRQMHKCVGPCDGSVSLDAYGHLVAHAAEVAADPQAEIDQQERRMRAAAADMRFETAADIKQFIAQLAELRAGPFKFVSRLTDLAWLTVQRGPKARAATLLLITPGQIRHVCTLKAPPEAASDLLRTVYHTAEEARRTARPLTEAGADRMAVLANHLYAGKHQRSVFLPVAELNEKTLSKAYKKVIASKSEDDEEHPAE